MAGAEGRLLEIEKRKAKKVKITGTGGRVISEEMCVYVHIGVAVGNGHPPGKPLDGTEVERDPDTHFISVHPSIYFVVCAVLN